MLTSDDHARRRGKLLTSSQIASVVGLDYRSAASVWLYHQGVERDDDGDTRHRDAGDRLERPIAEWALDLIDPHRQMIRHDGKLVERDGWIGATPDFVLGIGLEHVPLEIKNTARSSGVYPTGVEWAWGEDGSTDVPPHVLIQTAWQVAVMNAPGAWVAVLIAGWDLRTYWLERDRELEVMLIEAGRQFWFERVIPGIEPEVGVHPDFDRLVRRYVPDSELTLTMDDGLASLAEDAVVARERVKAWEGRVAELDLAIKARMREATVAVGDGLKVTWKPTSNGKRPLLVKRSGRR